ncbi:MAG: autotransporter-associated beta strand repeat-containing protein [Luteolibacter sp.]|uniref:beta strand repeat-containing protein n=1 Tax=Luteolibacter sp. TaxID=1962973 RepID=UPI0032635549
MKPKFNILSKLPIAAIVVSFAGIIQSAQAATDTWDGAASGIWNTSALNWNSGGVFTGGNDALFTGTPTNNVTTATGLTIGVITLNSTFTGLVTLTGANTVTGPITIQSGKLIFSAANQLGATGITLDGGTLNTSISTNSTISITNVITVNSASTIQMTNTSPTGTPTFILNGAGKLTGSGALTIKGNGGAPVYGVGATDLVLNAANTGYTGNLTLQDGAILEYNTTTSVGTGATFTVGNNGVFSTNFSGTDTHALTLNSGGTLASQNSSSVIGGAITLNGDAFIHLRDWYDATDKNLAITSTITGAHALNVNSGGDTGTGATLTLRGFDANASSADISLNGASLAIDSSAGSAAVSVTRGNSLTINTGNLTVTGLASQATNDVFTTLNLGGGTAASPAYLQGYCTLTMTPNAATNAMLTFTNMGTRTAGSFITLTGTFGGTPGANMGNIYFTNAMSSPNLIGGGGALGSSTSSVIPWLRDNGGNTLFTYDATKGVTGLSGQTNNINAGATANVSLSSTPTLGADTTINALQLSGNSVTMAGHTLTITSGALTQGVNGTIGNDGSSANWGTLNFGAVEGIISVSQARTLNINSAITGSGGLTYIGYRPTSSNKGLLVLNGANTFTGVTNIFGYGGGNNAVLFLTNSLALQNSTLNYVANRASNISFGNGGTSGQATYTFGGLSGNLAINLNNNNTAVGAVALTVGGNNDSTTYSGVLSSTVAGGSLTKIGTGTLTLTGVNTYTGDTTVNGGVLAINGTAIANTGKLVITTGQVAVTGVETVGALTLGGVPQGSGTYNASTPGGYITGSGSILVVGGYTGWAATNANGQASNLDFDNDGTSNGIEYFMGATGSSFTANPGIVGSKVTWPKDPAYSGAYTVQTSPDLVTWTNVASTVVGNTVEYTVPTGQGKIFVRLDVTPN